MIKYTLIAWMVLISTKCFICCEPTRLARLPFFTGLGRVAQNTSRLVQSKRTRNYYFKTIGLLFHNKSQEPSYLKKALCNLALVRFVPCFVTKSLFCLYEKLDRLAPLAEILLRGTKISISGAEPAQLTAMVHLIFRFWFRCDENATIGDKMIYASSKDTIKKTFTGLLLEFQANDEGDLDYTTLRKEVETRNA